MDANEALNSFDLDPRLFYDAISSYSTDDYLYIIDMKTDMALASENTQQDFDLPGRVFEGPDPPVARAHSGSRPPGASTSPSTTCSAARPTSTTWSTRCATARASTSGSCAAGCSCATAKASPMLFSGAVTSLERKGEVDATTGLFAHGKCLQVLDRLLARERPSGGILLFVARPLLAHQLAQRPFVRQRRAAPVRPDAPAPAARERLRVPLRRRRDRGGARRGRPRRHGGPVPRRARVRQPPAGHRRRAVLPARRR